MEPQKNQNCQSNPEEKEQNNPEEKEQSNPEKKEQSWVWEDSDYNTSYSNQRSVVLPQKLTNGSMEQNREPRNKLTLMVD